MGIIPAVSNFMCLLFLFSIAIVVGERYTCTYTGNVVYTKKDRIQPYGSGEETDTYYYKLGSFQSYCGEREEIDVALTMIEEDRGVFSSPDDVISDEIIIKSREKPAGNFSIQGTESENPMELVLKVQIRCGNGSWEEAYFIKRIDDRNQYLPCSLSHRYQNKIWVDLRTRQIVTSGHQFRIGGSQALC